MYSSTYMGGSDARLLVLGEGPVEQVRLHDNGAQFDLGPERQAAADLACEGLRRLGQTVTANPIYRLHSWTVGPELRLEVSRGDYSQVVGTKKHPEWGINAQVLAVCCALECPQGFVIEQRSVKVAAAPGLRHIAPAGSIQPPATPWETLLQEALEELALDPSEMKEARCLGLVLVEPVGVYQLICSARTSVSLNEMRGRERSGAWEQDGLLYAPVDPDGLSEWLAEQGDGLIPCARMGLWVEGRRRWGEDWFEAQLLSVNEREFPESQCGDRA